MRHGVKLKKLGRVASHRKAMISNMIKSFIRHEKMITTVAKAKALRPYIEKMITKAKNDTTHNRRLLFAKLRHKAVTTKLFDDVAKRYQSRPGGYVRILKLYNRKGDNAPMAFMELVEEENLPKKAKVKKVNSIIHKRDSVKNTDSTIIE